MHVHITTLVCSIDNTWLQLSSSICSITTTYSLEHGQHTKHGRVLSLRLLAEQVSTIHTAAYLVPLFVPTSPVTISLACRCNISGV
jgi:hypothetical protein